MRRAPVAIAAAVLVLSGCAGQVQTVEEMAGSTQAPDPELASLVPDGDEATVSGPVPDISAATEQERLVDALDQTFLRKQVGEQATAVSRSGVVLLEMTVTGIEVDIACTREEAEPPRNGHYVGMTIEATAGEALADSPVTANGWAFNNSDFRATPTNRLEPEETVGNSASCLEPEEQLPFTLEPGETATGTVVLDTSLTRGHVIYTPPLMDGGWSWLFAPDATAVPSAQSSDIDR